MPQVPDAICKAVDPLRHANSGCQAACTKYSWLFCSIRNETCFAVQWKVCLFSNDMFTAVWNGYNCLEIVFERIAFSNFQMRFDVSSCFQHIISQAVATKRGLDLATLYGANCNRHRYRLTMQPVILKVRRRQASWLISRPLWHGTKRMGGDGNVQLGMGHRVWGRMSTRSFA